MDAQTATQTNAVPNAVKNVRGRPFQAGNQAARRRKLPQTREEMRALLIEHRDALALGKRTRGNVRCLELALEDYGNTLLDEKPEDRLPVSSVVESLLAAIREGQP